MTTPLPPTDPSSGDDKLPGEAELAALYRQLPQNVPGPELDAAVLRAAARALEGADDEPRVERRKGPREPGDWVHPKPVSDSNVEPLRSIESAVRAPRRRTPSWLIALGSAASLVLVAGLAWHMRTAPTASPAQVGGTAPSLPAAATPPAAKRLAGTSDAEPAAPERSEAAIEAKPNLTTHNAVLANAPRVSAKPAAAPPVVEAPQRMSYTTAASDKTRAMQPMAAAPAMQLAQPPPPPVEEVSSAGVSAAPPAPPAPPSPTAAANDSAGTAASATDTPAQELGRIQLLFAQGHDDEARRRLLDFHRAHPQWPLPQALQEQLPKP